MSQALEPSRRIEAMRSARLDFHRIPAEFEPYYLSLDSKAFR